MVQIKHVEVDFRSSQPIEIEHNFGTRFVVVQIYDQAGNQQPAPIISVSENMVRIGHSERSVSTPMHVVIIG